MAKNATTRREVDLTVRRADAPEGREPEETFPLLFLGSDRYGHWFGRPGEVHEVFVFGADWWWGQWTLGGPRPRLGRVPVASRSECHIAPPARMDLTDDGSPSSLEAVDLGLSIVTEPEKDAWVEGAIPVGSADTAQVRVSKHRQFAVVAAFEEPFRYHYLRWGAQLAAT